MKLSLAALRGDYQQVGKLDRAIVAKRVPILAGLGIIAGELVRDGLIPDGLANGVTHWATVVFTALGVAAGALWAQRGTTPTDPQLLPKDKYGNELVSALSVGPHAGLSTEPDGSVPTASAALAAAAAVNPAGTARPSTQSINEVMAGLPAGALSAATALDPTAHSDTEATG